MNMNASLGLRIRLGKFDNSENLHGTLDWKKDYHCSMSPMQNEHRQK